MSPNPAVLTMPHKAPAPAGALIHDVYDCGVNHNIAAHVAAGHPLAGAWASDRALLISNATNTLWIDSNSLYQTRILADAGVTDLTVSARINGLLASSGVASDRGIGVIVGATSPGSASAVGAVATWILTSTTNNVHSGPITTGWATPVGVPRGNVTLTDDMILAVTLSGLNVTVKVDGTTISTYTLTTAPTGTYAGGYMTRTRYDTAHGYKWIKGEV